MTDKTRTRITVEDLLAVDEDVWMEVVNGEWVDQTEHVMSAGFLHATVIVNLYDILRPFTRKHDLGRVLPDGLTYILHVDENGLQTSRIPDFSFLRKGRITKDMPLEKPFEGAPELAVEVVSPTETAASVQSKVTDYLRHGSEQVWVIYPSQQLVHVYDADTPERMTIYRAGERFRAETLFPGLEIGVDALFMMDE